MPAPLPELDSREPRGIIIQTGFARSAPVRFWAYLWSEELEPAGASWPLTPSHRRAEDSLE